MKLNDSTNKTWLQQIFNNTSVAVLVVDKNRKILEINKTLCEMWGYEYDELIHQSAECLHVSTESYLNFGQIAFHKVLNNMALSIDYQFKKKDNSLFWVNISGDPIHNANEVLWMITDITAKKNAEEKLKKQHLFLQSIIDGVTDNVFVINTDYSIALMNQSARSLLDPQYIQDKAKPKCYEVSHKQNYPCNDSKHPCPLKGVLHSQHTEKELHEHIKSDGSTQIVELTATPLKNDSGEIYAIIESAHDISSLVESQNKLRERAKELDYRAHYDTLTGLSNRTLFIDRLNQAIKYAHRENSKIAIFFIDLDHFKEINDSLGHSMGDIVLKQSALRLQKSVRDMDSVARLGGDEFTVIIDRITDTDILAHIATKIIHTISQPIHIDKHKLYVSASIGISLYPDDGNTVEILLRNADAAMYKAKNEGRNTYQYYTEELTHKAFEHISLESSLRHALLAKNELVVFYQPQVNTISQQLIGMEALVRWDHPDVGLISPAQFIPLAEKTGLIIPIGEQVLNIATKQISQWHQEHTINGRIAINLSTKQLQQKDIVHRIACILKNNHCKPEWLELEITEGYIMSNPQQAINTLQKFQDMGISIAIDDFGTGYSSLAYLKRLPINKLKIDQSFIRDINTDEDDRAIVISIIALAKSMKLKVIAEGVETIEQSDFLKKEGCSNVQGFLYAKPMPNDQILAFFQKTIGMDQLPV